MYLIVEKVSSRTEKKKKNFGGGENYNFTL